MGPPRQGPQAVRGRWWREVVGSVKRGCLLDAVEEVGPAVPVARGEFVVLGIKAWCPLLLPVSPRWAAQQENQRRQLLRMKFRTFLAAFIEVPCQIVKGARQVRWRVLGWNPWLGAFFRLLDAL